MAGMYPDNQKITVFGEAVEWPGVGTDGKFTNGSFSNPMEKPSFIPAETVNLLVDNISELVKKLGGNPNNTSISQLAEMFTSSAAANKAVMRNTHGRAQVSAPVAQADIARKAEVDAESSDRKTADSKVLQDAKDYSDALLITFFQNCIWVQKPGYPIPEVVFKFEGYRWKEVNFNGCFFRAKGKSANSFNGGEQTDAIRNITGGVSYGFGSGCFSGAFKLRQQVNSALSGGRGYGYTKYDFDASRVVPTANENRPRNLTECYWILEKL